MYVYTVSVCMYVYIYCMYVRKYISKRSLSMYVCMYCMYVQFDKKYFLGLFKYLFWLCW